MSEQTSGAWRCQVCGYIHRGPHAPHQCPVCGVPQDQFEAYREPAAPKAPPATKWKCSVCNYEHTGDKPPAKCPICAALADAFEAMEESKPVSETSIIGTGITGTGRTGKIVIIGAGIAGLSALEAIRRISKDIDVTVLSKEKELPYYRLNLTRFLAGELPEENLTFYPESWYQEQRVEFKTGAEVSAIDCAAKTVTLKSGESHVYDKLILTAGAHPFVPAVTGVHREGVTTLRDLNSAKYILKEAPGAKNVVIVGGGILGLEIAGALAKLGNPPTLLERFTWIMPRQLNRTAAELLADKIKSLGISLRVSTTVREIVGDERVAGVITESGETIPADMVIISAGVRANSYLARISGLNVNRGILVNDHLQTSCADVYAAGDIAEHRGQVSGLWNAAQFQGNIAGMNAAGENMEFGGIPRSNTIKVLGVDLLSIGKFEAEDGSDIVIEDRLDGQYCRFVFRDSYLVGAILYGNTGVGAGVKKAIENKKDFSGVLAENPSASDVWASFW